MRTHTIDSKTKVLLARRAQHLRAHLSWPEQLLWQRIRSGQLGVPFRRQVVLDRFIVDFVAPRAKLIVEVDGSCHQFKRSADARRDRKLARLGYRVLRLEAQLNWSFASPRSHWLAFARPWLARSLDIAARSSIEAFPLVCSVFKERGRRLSRCAHDGRPAGCSWRVEIDELVGITSAIGVRYALVMRGVGGTPSPRIGCWTEGDDCLIDR